MIWTQDLPNRREQLGFSNMQFQASGRFLNEYEALRIAGRRAKVSIDWYQILSSPRPIGLFRANVVAISPMPGAGASQLRPATGAKGRPRHPPAPRGADGPHEYGAAEVEAERLGAIADDDIDVVDSEDEEEESDAELAQLLEEVADWSAGGDGVVEGKEAAPVEPKEDEAMEAALAPEVAGGEEQAPEASVPPPPPPAVGEGRPRRGATVSVAMPGGTVAYYASKQSFEAVCDHRSHGRCVLTRTKHAKGKTAAGLAKGGRPVGYLAAWLAAGEHEESKAAHWRTENLKPSYDLRATARAQIAASGEAGRLLLSCERPRAEGESDEPASLEGYYQG